MTLNSPVWLEVVLSLWAGRQARRGVEERMKQKDEKRHERGTKSNISKGLPGHHPTLGLKCQLLRVCVCVCEREWCVEVV